MPGFVIDASATLPWCFADEATRWTEGLLDRLESGEEARVPAHWPIEVMNGLIMAVRRKRIDLDRVARFAGDLAALRSASSRPMPLPRWNTIIQVATEQNLTIYDAAYLELAQRTGLPLATLDGDLRKAARAKGARLLEEA